MKQEQTHNHEWKVHAQLEDKRTFIDYLFMGTFWISTLFMFIITILAVPFLWFYYTMKSLTKKKEVQSWEIK